jgi:amino acid transporter
VSSLVATLGMLVVGVAYYFWSVTFPRSGGNYVYQSRVLSPGVAFTTTFAETVILMFYAALAASLLVTVGLSAGFGVLGFITDSSGLASLAAWFGKPTGIFITGTIILLFCGLLPLTGMARYFAIQRWLFVLAIVGTIVTIAVLLGGSQETFAQNLKDLSGLDYAKVIASATAAGWTRTGGFGSTLRFIVWPLLPLLGGIQSIGIAGEIKQVNRSQLFGILGSIAAAGVAIVAIAALSDHAFGYSFQGAVSYNFLSGTGQTTSTVPYFTLLVGILTDNTLLSVIIVAAFAAWIYFWIPAELIYAQRTMLAWSFDRLAPEQLSYVHPRYHTPVVAIAFTVIVSIFFMWVIAFTSFGTLSLILGILLCWGTTMAAGVLFPYVRKEMFARSPIAKYRVAGIPLMSIVCALSLAFMVWMFVYLWNDSIAAGHTFRSLMSNAVLLVLGAAIYVTMRMVRRRQGVKLELAFKQIPIE